MDEAEEQQILSFNDHARRFKRLGGDIITRGRKLKYGEPTEQTIVHIPQSLLAKARQTGMNMSEFVIKQLQLELGIKTKESIEAEKQGYIREKTTLSTRLSDLDSLIEGCDMQLEGAIELAEVKESQAAVRKREKEEKDRVRESHLEALATNMLNRLKRRHDKYYLYLKEARRNLNGHPDAIALGLPRDASTLELDEFLSEIVLPVMETKMKCMIFVQPTEYEDMERVHYNFANVVEYGTAFLDDERTFSTH